VEEHRRGVPVSISSHLTLASLNSRLLNLAMNCPEEQLDSNQRQATDTLLTSPFETYDSKYGLGYMSCSVYDTAWIANITKTVAGREQYIFPSSFYLILNAQLPDGSWRGHSNLSNAPSTGPDKKIPSSHSDAVLSTMSALYTLLLHPRNPFQLSKARIPPPTLDVRILRAVDSLERMLACWHSGTCNTVGFEVISLALLDVLSSEGYKFEFPDQERLLARRKAKMTRLQPDQLHHTAPSALLHSLEAFLRIDGLDMGNFRHHLVDGSMMASPAATASYLMRSAKWDDTAEAYLRLVVECGEGRGTGAVPSAWPSTNFEILWVRTTRPFAIMRDSVI
jgi:hypothetical protein